VEGALEAPTKHAQNMPIQHETSCQRKQEKKTGKTCQKITMKNFYDGKIREK